MISSQTIEQNLPQLALQLVMERKLAEMENATIYSVIEPWQKAELQNHPLVITIQDAITFETAVEAADAPIIYVPLTAAITQSLATSILARHSLSKTILWEGHKNA